MSEAETELHNGRAAVEDLSPAQDRSVDLALRAARYRQERDQARAQLADARTALRAAYRTIEFGLLAIGGDQL